LTCHLYRITYAPGLSGLAIGQNKVNLDGCYGLSNPIEVHKNFVDGGVLELATGGTTLTVCTEDGIADPIDFVVTHLLEQPLILKVLDLKIAWCTMFVTQSQSTIMQLVLISVSGQLVTHYLTQ